MHELTIIKKRLLSFAEYAKDAQPDELVTLINTVVERIYITTEEDKRICQIFIKGCTTEDYTEIFGTADYIAHNTVQPVTIEAKMCDSEQYSILNIFCKFVIFAVWVIPQQCMKSYSA